MDLKILDKLCCPSCKSKLGVKPFFDESDEIIVEGVLLCAKCRKWFPIISYVPIMLIFKTNIHQAFAEKYSENLKLVSDYHMVDGQAKPGELSVQETFSEEWDIKDIAESELSFSYTLDDLVSLNKDVFLRYVSSMSAEIKCVLEVGCGIGMETLALSKIFNDAEIYAIDFNYALLNSGSALKINNNIHLVVASLFDIPFHESSFNLVYSQGVIHHTYSTYKALESISTYVKENGYLFIWVYGPDEYLIFKGFIGLIARLKCFTEIILRPVVSRLPKKIRDPFFKVISIILHPVVKMRVCHKNKWDLKATEHGLRDWLSPRYAFRSHYNNVIEWFENLGFQIVDVLSIANYRRLFQRQLTGVGLTGRKLG